MSKARYLAIMVRRIIDCKYDQGNIDDKDYYGNKRLETAGQLMGLLFENLFKSFNINIKKLADKHFEKKVTKRSKPFDIALALR